MDLAGAIMAKKVHPLDTKLSNHRKFKSFSGRFGVEIELEGVNLQQDIPGWVHHNDGSLRDGGLEFVLEKPLSGGDLADAMRRLNTALSGRDVEVRLSPRASTHIHINMQKETLRTIFYFLTLYSVVDPLLCRLAGATRDGNLFCLPQSDSGNMPDTVERMVAYSVANGFASIPQRGKYASLNQNTLLSFGSLESRVYPPTITPNDVIRWTGWLDNILGLCHNTKSDRELRERIDLARTNPMGLVQAVFGGPNGLPVFDCERAIHIGCEIGYEVYRAYRFGQTADGQKKHLGRVMYE